MAGDLLIATTGIISSKWSGFLCGFAGGLVAEFLVIYNYRERAFRNWPQHFHSRTFWVIEVLMWVLGGLLVVAYMLSNTPMSVILAVNVGASAPLILYGFTKYSPTMSPGTVKDDGP